VILVGDVPVLNAILFARFARLLAGEIVVVHMEINSSDEGINRGAVERSGRGCSPCCETEI
jgi:hypothetical protein